MIRNAFTGELWTPAKSPAQQQTDFTAENAPAPTADAAPNARVARPAR